MKDKKSFGLFIKTKRIEKNYSQKDLAELLFVTESAVSKWERGVTYPDITMITDICRILEITEHELIESSHDVEYRKMKKDAAKFNNIKNTLFWILNICYVVAILVCFIVNLAVEHTLSWFFIVLTAIMSAYSFCPTITWVVTKYKIPLFIGSTFVSLFLLLLTCSVYTNNYWFMIPTMGLLLGYFIIFYPILFKKQKEFFDDNNYEKLSKLFLLSYSVGIFLILSLLYVFIYLYNPFNIGLALIITGGCMVIPIIFGILMMFNMGKCFIKLFLLTISGLIVLIFIFGTGRAIYLKSTEVIKTHTIIDSYSKINIDIDTNDINIYLSDKNENKAVYVQNEVITFDVEVIDGILNVRKVDNRKFYDHFMNFTIFKLDLYLSLDVLNDLNIHCSTGDITIHQGLTFEEVKIVNSTGDIEIKSNVSKNLDIQNSTGDIKIENCNINGNINIDTKSGDIEVTNVNCNKFDIEISTGKTNLTNVLVTGDFNIEGSTGDLELDGFDADNINVKLSTGDVIGTILTTKFFIANSRTGKVSVPKTREGGVCEINVSTGDIIIDYK